MARVCIGAPFKKRTNANPTTIVATMKLFLCLALFSLSSAETLFRQNLHQSEHLHEDQAHNVYKRDTGSGFTMSGDCSITAAGGDYSDVKVPSSGNCYLTYRGCSGSSGGNRISKINNVYTQSSGSIYIKYCSSSSSGLLANAIYISSSGNVNIENCCGSPCRKLAHEANLSSSGKLFITNCCASSCSGLFDNLIQSSSGSCQLSGACK